MNRYHIRWAISRDLPAMLRIEHASHDYPWSEDELLARLRRRDVIGMVAEKADRVVGFMVYRYRPNRVVLLDFAVACDARRQGVGRAMAAKLDGKLGPQRNRIVVEVRETNVPAQLFFREVGFRAVEVIRGRFPTAEAYEDGYVMDYLYDDRAREPQDCYDDARPIPWPGAGPIDPQELR